MKKIILFLSYLCIVSTLFSQNLTLSVESYQNSCTRQKEYPSGESIITWKLSTSYATMYYGTNFSPIENFKVVEFEDDFANNNYVYTFYDSKRKKYGIIVYFKKSQNLSMQYVDSKCSLDYKTN